MTRPLSRLVSLVLLLALGIPAAGQVTSTVFLQDSQRASEALPRAQELASAELYDEAARVVDELIRTDGELVIESSYDDDVLLPVRARAHEVLRSRPELLERYRELHGARARALLEAGEPGRVESWYLLTPAGFDAALAVAREHVAEARFHTAWRTLEQLDGHPDLRTHGRDAAAALSDVWRYLAGLDETELLGPEARAMLERWRSAAGMGGGVPEAIETPELPAVRTVLDDPGPVRIEGVLSQPLVSREMGPPARAVMDYPGPSEDAIPPGARVLPTAPVLVGDTIYTNTTETISAWNRFTGQQLWSTRVDTPMRQIQRYVRQEQLLEEVAMVAASDGAVVALTQTPEIGIASERALVGLDPSTGAERWRVMMSDMSDPTLRAGILHGPAVMVEGVVVVSVKVNDTSKRTIVHHLLGFDASEGRLLWKRPIASVGAQPYSMERSPSEGIAPRGADVVHVSSLGAIARVEGATGRVRWVRREVNEDMGPRIASLPATWRFQTPEVGPERLFVLSPDRRWVLDLDSNTGERRARSNVRNWDNPYTLLRVGDVLVGVSDRRAVMCPVSRIQDADDIASMVVVPGPDGTEIRGRAVRAGGRLFFPTVSGLYAVDVPQPDDAWLAGAPPVVEGDTVPLDNAGNALLLDGQVIVADDTRLYTYFAWNVARELLIERERRAPGDPGAPITYAQLAYRAGEIDDIAPALDRAMGALANDPFREDFDTQRRTMFDAVLGMARPDRDASRIGRLSPSLRRELLDRLARLARTPEERVASLMTAGAYFEATNESARAIERYQRLLAHPELHAVPFDDSGMRVPAFEEVARRLMNVVSAGGRQAYDAYDRLAAARAGELGDDASIDDLEALARAYPVARITPRLYERMGDAFLRGGQPRRAVDAYETGLRRVLPGEQRELASELAGRAIVEAAIAGRLASARLRLGQVTTLVQGAPLRYRGRELDNQRLRTQIERLERAAQRRPRISGRVVPQPDVLPGLRVQAPILRDRFNAPTATVVMRDAARDELSLWSIGNEGVLREVWGGLAQHDLVHYDGASVYTTTLEDGRRGRRVFHCFDTATGRELWRTEPFEELWSPERAPDLRVPGAEQDLGALEDTSREIIAAMTDRTLVLVERSGRAAGVDLRTGEPLWSTRLPMVSVLDVDAGSGVVAAMGLRRRTLEELAQGRREPAVIEERLAVLDERTGETLHAPTLDETGRWVRVTPGAGVIVGVQGRVYQYETRTGRLVARADINDLSNVRGIKVFPGAVYALSSYGPLYAIRTSGGRLAHTRVETGGRIDITSGRFEGTLIDDLVYLASSAGFCAFDAAGTLVTADSRPRGYSTLVPEFSERYAVAVSSQGVPTRVAGVSAYTLTLRDLETGRLADDPLRLPMPSAPDTIRVMDGHVLITADATTVVLHAPPVGGYARTDDEAFDVRAVYAAPEPAPAPADDLSPDAGVQEGSP